MPTASSVISNWKPASKSMEEARAAGMSEAQIRAQFGNLVLEDKGSKSSKLNGKASGRDKSTEGNFSLTMDGNQLVKFDDASWGISPRLQHECFHKSSA
ncbi:MAG: hypothetical protein R3D26_03700 [Cyanobacteriota/Melainabacteria group bacterium]